MGNWEASDGNKSTWGIGIDGPFKIRWWYDMIWYDIIWYDMCFCCKRLRVSRGYAPLPFPSESLTTFVRFVRSVLPSPYAPMLEYSPAFIAKMTQYFCGKYIYKYIFWHENIKMQMPINMVNTSLMTWEFWHLFTCFLSNMNMHQKHAQINPETFCHVLETKSPKAFQRQPLHIFAPYYYLPGNELLQVTPKFSSKNQLRA